MAREYRNAMLISPDEVKAISQVNYNVQDDTIGYAIRTAQEIYLNEIIGTALYYRLQELVYNAIVGNEDNIDAVANVEYAVLLDEYITPYLVAKSAVECLMPLSFKVRNLGVTKDSDTNVNTVNIDELKYVITYNETQVAEYATRISQFLYRNKDNYVELNNCTTCGVKEAQIGRKYANTPLFIGNNNGCKCK